MREKSAGVNWIGFSAQKRMWGEGKSQRCCSESFLFLPVWGQVLEWIKVWTLASERTRSVGSSWAAAQLNSSASELQACVALHLSVACFRQFRAPSWSTFFRPRGTHPRVAELQFSTQFLSHLFVLIFSISVLFLRSQKSLLQLSKIVVI